MGSLPVCCRRKLKGGERYTYFSKNFEFDVDRANELVQDGREPMEVEEASVRKSVYTSYICKKHVLHTNPKRPGIIACVQCLAEDGEVIHGHVLIDGNHRAAHCLELGIPFFAFILTPEESEEILVRKPTQMFPKRTAAAANHSQVSDPACVE